MATIFLSNAKTFLPRLTSPCSSSSSAQLTPTLRAHVQITVCKATNEEASINNFTRRSISINFVTATATTILLGLSDAANAAILEADENDELMERIKEDRKKRIEKQAVIKSATKETASLQDLVYKLSKVGEALEKNDLSTASSVLGTSKDAEWVKNTNSALNKLSSSSEEKTEADAFSSSLASLISSVSSNDIEASKIAFVASAISFEKWTTLSGLVEQLKGL